MPRNFYHILGVSRQASQQEIRKAFRSLAMKYHPDSNTEPDAHQQFIQINEAYQTLSDPFKRHLYDRGLTVNLLNLHRYDAKMARPQYRYSYRPPVYRKRKTDEYKKYAEYVRISSIIAIGMLVFLLLDVLLVRVSDIQNIERITYGFGHINEMSGYLISDESRILVDIEKIEQIPSSAAFRYYQTPMLGIVTRLEVYDSTTSSNAFLSMQPHYGIYNFYSFFMILLAVSAGCGLLIRKENSALLFNFGLLNLFLMLLIVIITLNS